MSRLTWPLRLMAVAGPVAVLLWQVVTLPPLLPPQDVCIVAAFVLALWVPVSPLRMGAARLFLRHGDLLVPLGLYVTAVPVANALVALPVMAPLAAPVWSGHALGLGVSLSAGL